MSEDFSEDVIKLVVKRIEQTHSKNVEFIIGNRRLDKDDIIQEIKEQTEIGKQFVKAEMDYLRSFSKDDRFKKLRKKIMNGRSEG